MFRAHNVVKRWRLRPTPKKGPQKEAHSRLFVTNASNFQVIIRFFEEVFLYHFFCRRLIDFITCARFV